MAAKILEINKKKKAKGTSNPLCKRLYTIPEAANYLGRSSYSLRCLIWAGELHIIRQGEGGKIWIDLQDLDSWILRNKSAYLPLPSKKKN